MFLTFFHSVIPHIIKDTVLHVQKKKYEVFPFTAKWEQEESCKQVGESILVCVLLEFLPWAVLYYITFTSLPWPAVHRLWWLLHANNNIILTTKLPLTGHFYCETQFSAGDHQRTVAQSLVFTRFLVGASAHFSLFKGRRGAAEIIEVNTFRWQEFPLLTYFLHARGRDAAGSAW